MTENKYFVDVVDINTGITYECYGVVAGWREFQKLVEDTQKKYKVVSIYKDANHRTLLVEK